MGTSRLFASTANRISRRKHESRRSREKYQEMRRTDVYETVHEIWRSQGVRRKS